MQNEFDNSSRVRMLMGRCYRLILPVVAQTGDKFLNVPSLVLLLMYLNEDQEVVELDVVLIRSPPHKYRR